MARNLLKLEAEHAGCCNLPSNIYAFDGKLGEESDDGERVKGKHQDIVQFRRIELR